MYTQWKDRPENGVEYPTGEIGCRDPVPVRRSGGRRARWLEIQKMQKYSITVSSLLLRLSWMLITDIIASEALRSNPNLSESINCAIMLTIWLNAFEYMRIRCIIDSGIL
jgi:hypothetical protein